MMNMEASQSCLGWESINNMNTNRSFNEFKFSVSVIVVYAPVEPTDGESSDSGEFYLQLKKANRGRNMVQLCWPQAAWCCSELLVVVIIMNIINILVANTKLLKT